MMRSNTNLSTSPDEVVLSDVGYMSTISKERARSFTKFTDEVTGCVKTRPITASPKLQTNYLNTSSGSKEEVEIERRNPPQWMHWILYGVKQTSFSQHWYPSQFSFHIEWKWSSLKVESNVTGHGSGHAPSRRSSSWSLGWSAGNRCETLKYSSKEKQTHHSSWGAPW